MVLECFRMENYNPIDTPMAKGEKLSNNLCPKTPEQKEWMEKVPYANVVGSLKYAMLCTRLDISYVVGMVSRYQSNLGEAHWKAVKRILRYFNGIVDYRLCYQGQDLQLKDYTDADWENDLDERKSTSGYVFLLGNGVITWCSKKQTCIALSTIKAEFVTFSTAAQEAMWLKRFLCHLGVVEPVSQLMVVYSDSEVAIAYTKDPKYYGKTKHIDTRFNYVR